MSRLEEISRGVHAEFAWLRYISEMYKDGMPTPVMPHVARKYKTNLSERVTASTGLACEMDSSPASLENFLWYIGSEAAFYGIKDALQLEYKFWLTIFVVALLTRICYYYHKANFGKVPELYCKENTELYHFVKNHVTVLQRPYKPPVWCAESRCQTIARYFTPCSNNLKWEREVVRAKEGGIFWLDWFHNDDSRQFPDSDVRPTVLIVPGLTSTTQSGYISSMAKCLAESGYRILVLIYRGLDGMELETPLTYCATHTDDLKQTVEMFHQQYPKCDLYSIGASLGSTILGQYLSRYTENTKIKAAMLFCCPFDPPKCIKEMESLSNLWIMNYPVTKNLRRQYIRHRSLFEDRVNNAKVLNAMFLREFDGHFTAPVFGFASAEEYYEEASLVKRLGKVRVPLLCVGSNDDPFSPEWALPKKEICESDYVAMVMTHGGGHVSHIQERFPFSKTYFELIMQEYFEGFTAAK